MGSSISTARLQTYGVAGWVPVGAGSGASSLPVLTSATNVSSPATLSAADAVVAAPNPGASVTGTPTANSSASWTLRGSDVSTSFVVSGLTAGTLNFEATWDGTNWWPIWAVKQGSTPGNQIPVYFCQSNGIYVANTAGMAFVRIRATVLTPSVTVNAFMSSAQVTTSVANALPPGNNTIGSVNIVGSGGQTQNSGTITASAANTPGSAVTATTTAQVVTNVAVSGNITFHLVSSAFVGTLVFEASVDAGLNYGPVVSIREDGTGSESSAVLSVIAAFIRQYTAATPGLTYFRVRCSAFTSGSVAVVMAPGPTLIEPNPSLSAGSAVIGGAYTVDSAGTNKAKVGSFGDQVISISNPNSLAAGNYATLTPTGALNVAMDPTVLFADEFETSVVDTTNRWLNNGSVAATQNGTGWAFVAPGTTASATSVLVSIPSFASFSTSTFGTIVIIESAVTLGNHRFWGMGTPPVAPGTAAAPLQDAIGFELDTSGVLRASVYAAGTRVYTQALTRPVDGLGHRYSAIIRGDIAFFYIDTFDVPLAFTQVGPNVQLLPLRFANLNSASVTVGTPLLSVNGAAWLDQGRNATQISDGTYQFRKAKVGAGGDISHSMTSPNAAALGIVANLNPYGTQRVTVEPTTLFMDPFDGSTIDTNRWTAAGTQLPSQSNGAVTLAPTVGASVANNSTLISVPTFLSPGVSFLTFSCVATLEAAQTNTVNVHRFWGKGQVTSFTYSTPVTDGIGFEVEGTVGALQCVVYAGGTKYVVNSTNTALISSSVAGMGGSGTAFPTGATGSNYGAPLTWKGGQHRYAILVRSDAIYWYVEGTEVPVGVLAYASPNVQAMPLRVASITNNAATSLANTFSVGAFAVNDNSAQNSTISDATYPWRRGKVDTQGSLNVAIQGLTGTAASIRPDSVFRVAGEPSPLLYDTFDAALDTTNRWSTGGTVIPTSATGTLTVSAGTVALATSWLSSQAVMPLTINSYVTPNALVTTDSTLKTGSYRFVGLGVQAASPTVAAPLINGVGFEWIDTTGVLSGVVWSNSVRTQSVSLASVQSLDGGTHRYLMYYKTSRVYFEIDGAQVGSIAYPAPQVSNLPMIMLQVNGASTVSPAPVFTSTFLGVADSAHDNVFLSDGQFPWRKAALVPKGSQGNFALATQDLHDSGRMQTNWFHAAPIITTTAEVMQTLTGYKGGVAIGATATPSVVTAGKTYRITHVEITYIAATAIGSARVNLRANLTGSGVVGSPLVKSWQVGMPAIFTAGAANTIMFDYNDGLEFPAGTGIAVGVIGEGAVPTTATAVGYVMVSIEGYEY